MPAPGTREAGVTPLGPAAMEGRQIRLSRGRCTGHARTMADRTAELLFDRFAVTGAEVAAARPQVDPAIIEEIFGEAATMLHNGLALDHLDDHDGQVVVPELCVALADADPTAALMARFYAATETPNGLHDPVGVAQAYENVLRILQL
jgi:hypothetical protein